MAGYVRSAKKFEGEEVQIIAIAGISVNREAILIDRKSNR